jgi:formylglycine-generating enzyme required for sulfatase activity
MILKLMGALCVVAQVAAAGVSAKAESPLVKGGMAAVALSLDLKGAKDLTLVATVGPDNYDYDQAVWGEPRLILSDGSAVDLTGLAPVTVEVGYGELLVNKAHSGALRIAGQPLKKGFWAHAPSELTFLLPTNAVRFEAVVGLTAGKDKGSVVFRAEAGDQAQSRAAARRLSRVNVDALRRLIEHRQQKAPAPELKEALAQVEAARALASGAGAADAEKTAAAVEALTRKLLLETNPAVAFDEILFIRRKSGRYLPQNWQSNSVLPKNGHANTLCALRVRGEGAGRVREIYTPPNGWFIGDVDLHWNADRLLFSSIGASNAWHVFELSLADAKVRQVSRDNEPDINHYDACYLPDERVMFSCTALKYAVPCVNGSSPVANLFRMGADGSDMELLASDQEHSWCPTVLPDGRVLYLRWEYTDLPHSNSRILFTCNPDGTNQRAIYGSNSFWPNGVFYARPIPGNPMQFVGVVTGHHGHARKGELVLFDVNRGTQEAEGAVQHIPGYGKKVEAVVKDQLANGSWPLYLHPFPLDDTTFLVAMQPDAKSPMGLYLVDRFDNVLPLLEEAGCDLIEPVPLAASPRPRVQPDRIVKDDPQATVYIADIYEGPGLKGVPRGEVKNLRLYTYTYGFAGQGGLYGSIGMDGPWDMRRILGTVPVNPDGSALFKVPANLPIALQPLDAEGKALQVMRSWFNARNGEYLSCVGCHERASFTPQTVPAKNLGKPASIEPWLGPVRNFEFAREVQPVLDAYCVRCHNEPDPPPAERFGDTRWKPDLRGTSMITDWHTKMAGQAPKNMGGKFSVSYANLHRYVRRPGIESDIHLFVPMEWHADTTELILLLKKGHHGVRLSDEALSRLITWADLNAPFHGRWQTIVDPAGAVAKEAKRAEMRDRYAGLSENHESIELPPLKLEAAAPAEEPAPAGDAAPDGWPFDPAAKPSGAAESLDLGDGVKLELVALPGGAFLMGSADRFRDEAPVTRVEVRPFKMGRVEVTNRQFRRFRADHHSRRESRHGYQFGITGYDVNGDDAPAVRLSWRDAVAFCEWLSKASGKKVALPTEAQWEWAARAGSDRPFWYGGLEADFAPYANLADVTLSDFSGNPYEQDRVKARYKNPENIYDNWIPQISKVNDGGFLSEPSGPWKPNPWGLCDLHGNAAEWTRSRFAAYPYRDADGRNALDGDESRVVRGGSWWDRPKYATASFRRAYRPYQPVYNVGFRVVVEE